VTVKCEVCGAGFEPRAGPGRPRKTCSAACAKKRKQSRQTSSRRVQGLARMLHKPKCCQDAKRANPNRATCDQHREARKMREAELEMWGFSRPPVRRNGKGVSDAYFDLFLMSKMFTMRGYPSSTRITKKAKRSLPGYLLHNQTGISSRSRRQIASFRRRLRELAEAERVKHDD
jgi:hypothetical protein